MSTRDPDKSLSADWVSINVAGHKWFPKTGRISLDTKELNFAKKSRGKVAGVERDIPKKLTRVVCASKVGEIFDFSGLLVPITALWKVDLRNVRRIHWKDCVPENLRPIWEANFNLMGEIK